MFFSDGRVAHEPVRFAGEPGRVPSLDLCPHGHRHFLHRLVLRVRGDQHETVALHLQGVADRPGRVHLPRLRSHLFGPLGRHFCLIRDASIKFTKRE